LQWGITGGGWAWCWGRFGRDILRGVIEARKSSLYAMVDS
jgi:hypothetical protein